MKSPFAATLLLGLSAIMLAFSVPSSAGPLGPPALGEIPCETDWLNRSRFDTVPSVGWLKRIEQEAERGDLGAQLRLGYVRKTRDGQWEAPKDNSYAIKWLEKAKAQGSKTAEWQLLTYSEEKTHEAYLRSMMAAAEEEGNPWAATELMNLTIGRFNYDPKDKSIFCFEMRWSDKKCAPKDVLTIGSARKWAEIAAEGGNAQAQEWLCVAAYDGDPERGQDKDYQVAAKWCQIAAHNACSDRALENLWRLKRKKYKTFTLDPGVVKRSDQWSKQPWRKSADYFFLPR